MQNLPKEVVTMCEVLMSYPVGKLFTSDTPNKKEKKEESRCEVLVNKYWSIESTTHQVIRNLLHDLDSSLLLMSNEVAVPLLFKSAGQLQARYEAHKRVVETTVKQEPSLKSYYSVLCKGDWFGVWLQEVTKKNYEHCFESDMLQCKKWYFDSYKEEKLKIKEEQ